MLMELSVVEALKECLRRIDKRQTFADPEKAFPINFSTVNFFAVETGNCDNPKLIFHASHNVIKHFFVELRQCC